MRVILIFDPEGDMAAAALDVKAGSALEPLHGVAHFVEHMLFQGTEKYPDESEYMEFLSKNGGSDNAFTSMTDTNFHFAVSNGAFEEALDRLSQFFISPKFSEASTDREANAVDSEYKMSLQNDGWHTENLFRTLAAKDSRMNAFSCGSLETLSVPGIRDALLEFHETWYSANIMCLTVTSNHSLDDMEGWVRSKFGEVINKNVVLPSLVEPKPYPTEQLGKLVRYVPVQDEDTLMINWYLPYYGDNIAA